jgi:hypothetical protein
MTPMSEENILAGPTSQVVISNNKSHNRDMQVIEVSRVTNTNPTPITDEEGMFAHLVSNRLVPSPEVPSDTIALIVNACLLAVKAVREGNLDEVIQLPDRVSHNGAATAQAHELIDAFDLEDWII